jgi:hypothetical protein
MTFAAFVVRISALRPVLEFLLLQFLPIRFVHRLSPLPDVAKQKSFEAAKNCCF